MTAPAPEIAPATTDDDPVHYTCCTHGDFPYAMCGADVSGEDFEEATPENICRTCLRIFETTTCAQSCPLIVFGGCTCPR